MFMTTPPATALRPRVAILFHRFGPYHVSRLNRAAAQLDLCGVELSGTDRVYAWNGTEGEGSFRRAVVSPDIDREPGRAVVRRVADTLGAMAPSVVAVPGWSHRGALAALLWCLRSGTPAVLMSDSTERDHRRRAWQEAAKRRIVALCGSAFVAGTRQRDYLARLGMPPARVCLGFDVVDNAHFSAGADRARQDEAATRARLSLPGRYILTVCRFVEDKNVLGLIEAYDRYRIRARGGAWPLVIAGDGPLRPVIERMIADRNLGAQVHLPGFRQYQELPACYGLAGVFVLPSTMEPWGLVVNEAMAAGLPVLVSDRCGCADDLVGRNGCRFDPSDPGILGDLLYHVTSDACDRTAMALESRATIAAWTPDRFAAGLGDAVRLALGHSSPGSRFDRWLVRALVERRGAA